MDAVISVGRAHRPSVELELHRQSRATSRVCLPSGRLESERFGNLDRRLIQQRVTSRWCHVGLSILPLLLTQIFTAARPSSPLRRPRLRIVVATSGMKVGLTALTRNDGSGRRRRCRCLGRDG